MANVQNLLKYLKENQEKEEDQGRKQLFSITNQDEEKKVDEVIFQINDIELSHQATKMLQAKSRLQTTEFEERLKNFNTISLKVKYPTSSFGAIYEQLLKLKNKTKQTTGAIINISIFIS